MRASCSLWRLAWIKLTTTSMSLRVNCAPLAAAGVARVARLALVLARVAVAVHSINRWTRFTTLRMCTTLCSRSTHAATTETITTWNVRRRTSSASNRATSRHAWMAFRRVCLAHSCSYSAWASSYACVPDAALIYVRRNLKLERKTPQRAAPALTTMKKCKTRSVRSSVRKTN